VTAVPGTWLHRRLTTTGWLAGSGAVAVATLVAMREVGARVDVVSPDHRSSALFSVTEVWHAPAALRAWAAASSAGSPVRAQLGLQLALDLPFIAGYAGLALGATLRWPHLGLVRLVPLLVAVDLVEDGLAGAAVLLLPGQNAPDVEYSHPVLLTGLAVTTTAKTAIALALLTRTTWGAVTHRRR
jgi:hypothetical protein